MFATAKILIWKQFTTLTTRYHYLICCVCNCKDTNLKAIHNHIAIFNWFFWVVFATAKILIWKQFTTDFDVMQWNICCVCNCKDTNLKAIHNCKRSEYKRKRVVFATAKILIWKQFTTPIRNSFLKCLLCLQLQRY